MNREEARKRAPSCWQMVGIPEAENRSTITPTVLGRHAPAGMIAMALACNPQVLIADERPRRWT